MTIYRIGDAAPAIAATAYVAPTATVIGRGVQAVVLNGAVIGKQCLVGAGAIFTEGKVFADRSLILGAPAKFVRELTDCDLARLAEGADDYGRKGALYGNDLHPVS